MYVMSSMTVTSPYLRGPVDDPHVAGELVNDPRTNYLRGLVDDPCVAGRLVNDPPAYYLRELVDDPHVAGGLADDPHKITFAGWLMILAVPVGPFNDPRTHIIVTYLQKFPQDQPLSLKTLILVLFSYSSFRLFRRGIGCTYT